MQSGYREHNFFAISIPFISGISISKNTISGITDDESKENAVLKVKILIVSIFLSENTVIIKGKEVNFKKITTFHYKKITFQEKIWNIEKIKDKMIIN